MITDKQLSIRFGVLCDPLQKQLSEQGFAFEENTVTHYQECADAISRLKINGLLPEAQADKCFDRLYRKIHSHIAKLAQL